MGAKTSRSPWFYAWRRFQKNKLAVLAGVVLIVIILAAIFAPWITPTHYTEQIYLDRVNDFPSRENWFGVDTLGRDYFTRVIYGARVSLGVGFAAALGSLVIAVPLGTIAGYKGGKADWLVMRLVEIMSVIPPLLIAILLATMTGGGLANIVLIGAAFLWVNVCRLVRGQVMSLREKEFILASRALGSRPAYIIKRHLIPNTVAEILVGLVLTIPQAIILEASLSFLGVGISPPTPSWGQMISEGLYYIFFYWHLPLFPALMLGLTILCLSVVGDGIRDALDPTLKGR